MSGYAVNASGWRAVNFAADCLPGETFQIEQPAPFVDQNAIVKQQISALESQQTPRRIREAAIGIDGGWLKNLDAQIAALRKQLK